MSFDRPNPVPMNIHQVPHPGTTNFAQPAVATLPLNPYANSPPGAAPTMGSPTEGILNTATYSDKVFVIYGEGTKIHKESIKALGGKFNGRLKEKLEYGFPGGPAWMFSHDRQVKVMDFVNKVNTGAVPTQTAIPLQGNQAELPGVQVPFKNNNKFQLVKWKVFVPHEGMGVTVKANGTQIVGSVLQTETHRDVVDTCYIVVGETTSKLVICNGRWTVWGYMVDHSVYFRDGQGEVGDTDEVVNI